MEFELDNDIFELLVRAFTPERMGLAVTALLGTLAGGFTTFFVQTRLKKREQAAALKDKLRIFAMISVRIVADVDNVLNLIEYYRSTNSPECELWKVVHTIDVLPGFKPDLSQLEPLISLGSSNLVTVAMHLYSEYSSLFATIDRYNGLRKALIASHRKPDADEVEEDALEKNMIIHLKFIVETASLVRDESRQVQHLLYVGSQRHFGSGEFLKLNDD